MTGAPPTESRYLADLAGTYTLAELYAAVAAADLTERADGAAIIHGRSDTRWRRRVRGALQHLKRQGRARRAGDSVWVLDGPPAAPRQAVLVSLIGAHQEVELRLQRAADLLGDLDGPADLILTDPPYGLGVGRGSAVDTGARTYQRDESKVVAGYVDVDPGSYRAFTGEWVAAAAAALRPGGHLAVVTGPQQSAWVQVAGEDAGLTYVNKIAVGKVFPLRTTRRFAHAHWDVTVLCRGPLESTHRIFICPSQLPTARNGSDYPQDFWPVGLVGRADADPGRVRYRNGLPRRLVDLLLSTFTRPHADGRDADHVVDPFLGGGTVALAALLRGLRFTGGDVNPRALAFTAHRLCHALLRPVQPALFD